MIMNGIKFWKVNLSHNLVSLQHTTQAKERQSLEKQRNKAIALH